MYFFFVIIQITNQCTGVLLKCMRGLCDVEAAILSRIQCLTQCVY